MKQPKENMPVALDLGVATFRVSEQGDMAMAYVEMKAGADATPLLEGLSDDKCESPHWGYMLKGAIHLRYKDGTEEVCKAGDMFYWPSGHTVWVEEDTAFVEFSPKEQLKKVYDHIGEKAAAMSS
ncbi:cupin domain-containing protein [candidate division GN15 bacterium]|nr:cupin domain-containing protein [candidate division GN15 bacterium]